VVGISLSDPASNMSQGHFDNLTTQQCVDTYAVNYLSGMGTVVVPSNNLTGQGDGFILLGGAGSDIYIA